MKRFAVILTPGSTPTEETVAANFENYIKLEDNVFLIAADDTVKDIVEKLDPDDKTPLDGMVFSLNGEYGGRALKDTWEWLESTD